MVSHLKEGNQVVNKVEAGRKRILVMRIRRFKKLNHKRYIG